MIVRCINKCFCRDSGGNDAIREPGEPPFDYDGPPNDNLEPVHGKPDPETGRIPWPSGLEDAVAGRKAKPKSPGAPAATPEAVLGKDAKQGFVASLANPPKA